MWKYVILLGLVFVLTYDPKSKRIENFIEKPVAKPKDEYQHYQQVQFASPQPAEEMGFKAKLGAIVA